MNVRIWIAEPERIIPQRFYKPVSFSTIPSKNAIFEGHYF